MPSADSHYAMGLPYGSLTHTYACCCMPTFVFPPPYGDRLAGGQDAITHRHRGFGLPVLPFNPVIFQRQLPRRSGPPGVSTGYFQRTIVRYTGLHHLTDRGLYPVLRTRPDLAPPQICLPSTLSDTGHTCTSTHAFASGFLQPIHCCNDLAFSYPSPPSGWIWTLSDICVKIPDITI